MKTPLAPSRLAVVALSAFATSPLLADIVYELDATALPTGPLATWQATGTVGGDFVAVVDTPEVKSVAGVNAVTLDGDLDYYTGPPPLDGMVGPAPVRSIEVWAYNPDVLAEETMVAWGSRGGPDGSNLSFNYGSHGTFGAVGHWGAPDIGWNDAGGSPAANQWHHLVYTFDGSSTVMFADGLEANREDNIVLDTHTYVNDTVGGERLPIVIGAQNLLDGSQEPGLQGSLSIAKVRIHDIALDTGAVVDAYGNDAFAFGRVPVDFVDTDSDTLDDRWERFHFDNLGATADADPDSDNLDNAAEQLANTNPKIADTDGDGINDNVELDRTDPQTGDPAPTNPLSNDTDGDGLLDGAETDTGFDNGVADRGTDPVKADTDGDGFSDGREIETGSNPFNPASTPPTDPVIVLDATGLPTGELPVWTNTGSLTGDFDSTDDGFAPNVITVAGHNGVELFNDYYIGPDVPANMVGNNSRSIAAWVHNPVIASEETVFAWGRRGGPDGTNMSFNHGTHDAFGAVGHWGNGPDVGWDSAQTDADDQIGGDDQEVEDAWTHIAYTYNGATNTTTVYTNGKLTRADVNGPMNTHSLDDSGQFPLTFVVGAQNEPNGLPNPAAPYNADMTIGLIEVWDQALPTAVIETRFSDRALGFGLIPIRDTDSDGDGLGDGWETVHFGNLSQNASGNPDDDNLDNLGEFNANTDPNDNDSDDDDVDDGDEVKRTAGGQPAPTDPLNPDTDSDRLTDGQERDFGSNPLLANSDGDLFSDYIEFQEGSNPNDPDSIPITPAVTPVNHYAFSETTGTTVIDSIGGADGTIIGTGFTQNGSSLSLDGGTSADPNAAYVDLPNGLISAHTDLTIEGWFTLDAPQNWSRVFDFGSSLAGELFEHGGTGDGQDYIILSAQIGGNINQQRWEVRSFGISTTQDSNVPTVLGEQYHFALVFDEDGNFDNDPLNPALVSIYRDGVFLNSAGSNAILADILDDNVWLGRSNWTADNNVAGTYDDFRIYDTALREAQIINSFIAGPDAFSVAPGSIQVTDIQFDETTREVVLTWTSRPNATYAIDFTVDLLTPYQNIEDSIDSQGDSTTKRFAVGPNRQMILIVREE